MYTVFAPEQASKRWCEREWGGGEGGGERGRERDRGRQRETEGERWGGGGEER